MDSSNSSEVTDEVVESENVHLSLFMGYTNGVSQPQDSKLNKLVNECCGCALLDTGCSTTVCGESWLNSYVELLSDFDASAIVEKKSTASFTFGDGVSIKSLKRLVLPCYIGGKRCTLETDVVKCNVPLLFSKPSMKKGKMHLDFERDVAVIGGKSISLDSTASGHYLLPLTM